MRYLAWLLIALCGAVAATPALAANSPVGAAEKAYSQQDYKTAAGLWRAACDGSNAGRSAPQIVTLLGRAMTIAPDCYAARLLQDYLETPGLAGMDQRHAGEN